MKWKFAKLSLLLSCFSLLVLCLPCYAKEGVYLNNTQVKTLESHFELWKSKTLYVYEMLSKSKTDLQLYKENLELSLSECKELQNQVKELSRISLAQKKRVERISKELKIAKGLFKKELAKVRREKWLYGAGGVALGAVITWLLLG